MSGTPHPNPVAVVTGGARRLGRQLCTTLAGRGFDVVVLYRDSKTDADSLERELSESGRRARSLSVDVSVERRVAEVFDDIARTEGRVDVLVNNVGNYNPQHVTKLDPTVWDATLASNLSGAYYCCYHALKLMCSGGNIINIGMAGLEGSRATVHGTDYFVSKTGLLVLTKSLAVAYGEQNIRVNMVSPGQLDNSIDLPSSREIGAWVPMGRAGRLDDVTQAVEYLLAATYVSGVNLDISGGYRL
jgi:NAD(P)-dependent dehydrogenase (short-subunit alcohol dehydrogenase family)